LTPNAGPAARAAGSGLAQQQQLMVVLPSSGLGGPSGFAPAAATVAGGGGRGPSSSGSPFGSLPLLNVQFTMGWYERREACCRRAGRRRHGQRAPRV
jgi:hypothetical protein